MHTANHPGTLVIECRGDVTIEVTGVPKGEAENILTDLAARRTRTIVALDGAMYVVDGLSLVAARWSPDR